jgi:putative transposase
VEVSPTFISNITEAVMDEVRQWQNRPLDSVYPIIYVDCLVVKVRESQRVRNYALYLALGVDMEGHKELLGMWMVPSVKGPNSGSQSSPNYGTEARSASSLPAWMGSPACPKPLRHSILERRVHLCMVHLVRNSLKYVSYKHRKEVAADLKLIYGAPTEAEAQVYLDLKAREVGSALSYHQQAVACPLESCDPLVRLPRGHSQGDLHDQCH